MNNEFHVPEFNPSGVGLKNGNFIGLPFTENNARVVLIPVPWDVTVSYAEGTALAPSTILNASLQLDLYDSDVEDAWKLGIYMLEEDAALLAQRSFIRPKAAAYIDFLEQGGDINENNGKKADLNEINYHCRQMNERTYQQTKKQLEKGRLVGLVGGDHSTPLGYLQALAEKHSGFGILHIDAHMDLRNSYEGFSYSHASIFHHVLALQQVQKLVQVGIRDFCHEELERARNEGERISVYYDSQLKENSYEGMTWKTQCQTMLETLPELVYVSFEMDGLNPALCPNTGTPVPGGLSYNEVVYLLKMLWKSGRKIIGFDVCETGNSEWDANVAARLIYKLSNLMGKSMGTI